jgi:hypothetical protein
VTRSAAARACVLVAVLALALVPGLAAAEQPEQQTTTGATDDAGGPGIVAYGIVLAVLAVGGVVGGVVRLAERRQAEAAENDDQAGG